MPSSIYNGYVAEAYGFKRRRQWLLSSLVSLALRNQTRP